MAETQAKRDWDRQNTTYVSLKLNRHTDADILGALAGKPKQTEIKRLIREGLRGQEVRRHEG